MPRRLLVVTDTFAIRSRGLILAPEIDASEARSERFAVELRTPDGSRRTVEAFVQIPFHIPRPSVLMACVTLLGETGDGVPIGSEVWTLD